jgi:hypothetical protein
VKERYSERFKWWKDEEGNVSSYRTALRKREYSWDWKKKALDRTVWRICRKTDFEINDILIRFWGKFCVFYSNEDTQCSFTEYKTVKSGTWVSTFLKNILPPSSGPKFVTLQDVVTHKHFYWYVTLRYVNARTLCIKSSKTNIKNTKSVSLKCSEHIATLIFIEQQQQQPQQARNVCVLYKNHCGKI